jgi:hypothetical protein
MSKTLEEMAEQYTKDWWGNLPEAEGMRKSARENFLAGYKAAQEHAHAALEEAEAKIQELQDQLADVSKVMPDTCDHILDMEKMVDVNGWISVKDRLPKHGVGVLVSSGGPGCTTASYFEGSGFYNGHLEDVVITHWMPLPEPPKEQQ